MRHVQARRRDPDETTKTQSTLRERPHDDETTTASSILSQVQECYGKVLSKGDDDAMNACCSSGSLPSCQRGASYPSETLDLIREEITRRFSER